MTVAQDAALDFEKLFMSLGTAYIIFDATDPDHVIIGENQAHADMAMVKREDVIGKKLLDAFPDTSAEYKKNGKSQLIESIRKVVKTGKPDVMPTLSYDIKDQSGVFKEKFWEVTHSPLFNDKKVVAVVQQTKDITQSIVSERKLANTQEQLAQALTYSSVGTWIWDIEAGTMLMDKNSARLFGVGDGDKQLEVPMSEVTKVIHPDDVERVRKETQAIVKDKDSYENEYRVIDSEGCDRWLLARGKVVRDAKGKSVRMPGMVVDITERKQAEQKLHVLAEANTQFPASYGYRETLNSITAKLVPEVADWCSIELVENDVIEQVIVAHKEPEKVKWAYKLREESGPVPLDAPTGAARVIRTGQVEHTPVITDEMLVQAAKSKSQLKLLRTLGMTSAIIAPLKIDGKTIGAVTFISTNPTRYYDSSDVEIAKGLANRAALAVYNANLFKEARKEIKEREKLQKKLEQLNGVLESRVKTRTKQLESLNDGLNNEISRRQEVEAELQEYSKNLARSNQELQDFAYVASHDLQEPLRKIRAFGDILQAEYSEPLGDGVEYLVRMQKAASRMSTLIQDLLAFSRVTTRDQEPQSINLSKVVDEVVIDLEWRIEELGGTVKVDKLPVITADATHMRQLFQNLIGNALKFHRPGVAPVVQVSLCESADPDTYTICVEDNGIGFDERYLDRIFSVFQRLHGKEEYEGTGIGLAVVRKIVERYGGTITATSKKNVGSTFKISFPKKLEEHK